MRVTTAASGQGRFRAELDFAKGCHASGYTPILLGLDPTPSDRLDDLAAEYGRHGGMAYVGDTAWRHIEEKSGQAMATFIEKYVRRPISEVDRSYRRLAPLTLSAEGSQIIVRLGDEEIILTGSEQPIALASEEDAADIALEE